MALLALGVGIALLTLACHIADDPLWDLPSFWPLSALGGILVGSGFLGIVWDYIDGNDREARDDERVRRLVKEAAPEFPDAVVRGLAVEDDDLKGVATPELLDAIASNVLALRLGNRAFASEVYADVRDQAVRTPERWLDVDVTIRLSPIGERECLRYSSVRRYGDLELHRGAESHCPALRLCRRQGRVPRADQRSALDRHLVHDAPSRLRRQPTVRLRTACVHRQRRATSYPSQRSKDRTDVQCEHRRGVGA